MKKKSIYLGLLAALFLSGCGQKGIDNTSATDTVEQYTKVQKATSHTLMFDESIIFKDADDTVIGYPVSGLKMTVKKPVTDKNIVLGEGYPDSDKAKFEGKEALVVTTEVENITDDYIDLVGQTILDSEGKTLELTFVNGVSTQSIDGLTGGQKATIVNVYLANNDKPVTVTYANTTWKDGNKSSNYNAKKSSSTGKSSKVAKSSSTKSSDSKKEAQAQSTAISSSSDAIDNNTMTIEATITYNSTHSPQTSTSTTVSSNSEVVDQHAGLYIKPAGTEGDYTEAELESLIANYQANRGWAPNEFENYVE